MPIEYRNGDATRPVFDAENEIAIICHICNNLGAWGAGFVMALTRRFGERPQDHYTAWSRDDPGSLFLCPGEFMPRAFDLGETQLVAAFHDPVDPRGNTYIANMLAQDGFPTRQRPVAVDYDALEACLESLESLAHLHGGPSKVTIHMPRIGCGIGGGDWDKVELRIQKALESYRITVYDLP